jgi:hypothetical protein
MSGEILINNGVWIGSDATIISVHLLVKGLLLVQNH